MTMMREKTPLAIEKENKDMIINVDALSPSSLGIGCHSVRVFICPR